MDTGNGTFKPIDLKKFDDELNRLNKIDEFDIGQTEEHKSTGVFKEGEILEIRTSRFRIEKIQRKKMILKLLPKLNPQE